MGDNDSPLSTIEINAHSVYSCMHVTVEHVANGLTRKHVGDYNLLEAFHFLIDINILLPL